MSYLGSTMLRYLQTDFPAAFVLKESNKEGLVAKNEATPSHNITKEFRKKIQLEFWFHIKERRRGREIECNFV